MLLLNKLLFFIMYILVGLLFTHGYNSVRTLAGNRNAVLLTNGNWQLTSNYILPPIDINGDNITENELLPFYPSCEKDNFIAFLKSGIAINDEGPTKCRTTDKQRDTSYWQLIDNNTKLITRSDPSVLVFDTVEIMELSATTLKVKSIYTSDKISYTETFTFSH